ncbi:MAG TPA: hypothetical protein VHO49_20665 [Anaerolineales bacterium]|nr:hypothetical protein [Anaerolineales bacterium]
MKRVLSVFLVFLAACSSLPSSAPQSDALPPTPYPDTPSPAEIEAARVESPSFIRIEMMNELNGWAVTEAEIVRTNDGGLTWYNVTPPEMEETGYGVDTFVLDVEHAWVQKPDFENFPNGGFLYRTTDGGLTWTEFTVPFSRGDINFVDGDSGWVLADLGVGAGSNAVAVYRTNTGGAVWERMYTNDPNDPKSGDSLPLGGIKSDLVPLDGDTAWVTGTVYAPGEVYLHRTEDGGHTWTPVTVQLPESAQNFELGIEDEQMKFVSGTHGFFALRMSGESIQSVVYVTADAGNTWTPMPTVIEGAGPSAFLSEQEAVLYNGEQFYVTRDAARSWSMISPDIVFDESFVGMEFVNLLSGWVITMDPTNHKSLYRTHDGGATWLPVIP